MKKGIVVLLIIFIFPVVYAVPAAPYSVLSAEGSWIPVSIDENGYPIKPLYSKDNSHFKNLDSELGRTVFETVGDHDYSEVYELKTKCPIVFITDVITGQKKPYFGKFNSEGYIEPYINLQFKPNLRESVENAGVVCGEENIRQIRPFRPTSLEQRPLYQMYNPERVLINVKSGIGIKKQADGTQTYYDPYLQKQEQLGEIPPPGKIGPKPIIIFTGQAVYDEHVYQQRTLSTVVIPVQFKDVLASVSISDLEDTFFGNENSLVSYYAEQSYGALNIVGTVLPKWYSLDEDMGYYGDNYERNIEDMIVDAIYAADEDIDFSRYDSDGDGIVDGLFVVHAGEPDENGGGNGEEIWSHYYSISPVIVDGVKIIDYETVSEDSPIGIIGHEFGHYLGLPDLYDTVQDDGISKGTAEWSIMGYGGYMDPPGSFDPWSKLYLGWLDDSSYQIVQANNYYTIVEDTSSLGTRYYALPISDSEVFFIENRHEAKLINGDNAGGIVIWHVDEDIIVDSGNWNGCSGTRWDCNTVNGDADYKLIDVEETGEQNIDIGDLGEVEDTWYYYCGTFGGCQEHEFSVNSAPEAVSYDGTQNVYIGIYSDIGTTMELGVTLDGSILMALEEDSNLKSDGISAPLSSNNRLIILVFIIVLILVCGALFIAWRLMRKKSVEA